MKINWLTYTIEDAIRNKEAGHIQLNSYNSKGEIVNTYPVVYQTNPEIDEVIETTVDTPVVEWLPWENEGDPAIPTTAIKSEVVRTPTGNKIPNPQHKNPKSLKDIEDICIENWFTK